MVSRCSQNSAPSLTLPRRRGREYFDSQLNGREFQTASSVGGSFGLAGQLPQPICPHESVKSQFLDGLFSYAGLARLHVLIPVSSGRVDLFDNIHPQA